MFWESLNKFNCELVKSLFLDHLLFLEDHPAAEWNKVCLLAITIYGQRQLGSRMMCGKLYAYFEDKTKMNKIGIIEK
jgi:hypothetical protein